MASDKLIETTDHPSNGPMPSMGTGEYVGIGTHIPLKDAPNSANQKSGEPFGSGGK